VKGFLKAFYRPLKAFKRPFKSLLKDLEEAFQRPLKCL
jgi:hypothetical protein